MAGSRAEGPPWTSPVERQLLSRPCWRAAPVALWGGGQQVPPTLGGCRGQGEVPWWAELPGTSEAGRCHLTSRQKPFRADERDCNSSVCTGLCFRSALGWLSPGWAWRGNSCFSLGWPQHCRDWELCTITQLSFHFQQQKNEWIQSTQVGKKNQNHRCLQALRFIFF